MIIQNGKLLYHLTHIDNLDSIFTNGLLSRNNVQQLDGFVDVANHEILHSRHQHELDNYVLFHFHPYSAFDTAVKGNYGASNFVYITIQRELARQRQYKIIPRHPLNGPFQLYEYDAGFPLIDWNTMETKMTNFSSSEQTNHAKQVKMAECISPDSVLVSDFFKIYCNPTKKNKLQETYSRYSDLFIEGAWLN